MQCYAELFPPSGVTHALSIPFLSSSSNNLVVAKTSLLQVFSLVDSSTDLGSTQSEEKPRQDQLQSTKLVLVAEYTLPGTVTNLGKVKTLDSKSGGEAILIAFRHAKLSLIEWDPERHDISTISIHYYEGEDSHYSPWAPDLKNCASHLTVDPSSRCAILNFGVRNLAILPFHQPGDDLVMDDFDPDLDGERPDHDMNGVVEGPKGGDSQFPTPYASSFVLPLTALDPSLLHPISLAFLYEYREPTFGILYSQVATSSSLLHERKDVVFYSVFTLDLEQRASTTLLSVPRLPSDLSQVVPLPPPVGGALLIGSNEIVHVDQAGKTNAVGVNEFARQASTFSMADQSDLAMYLERCTVEPLGTENGDMLLALSTGETAIIRFKLDGRSVSGVSVQRISERAGGSILKSSTSCSANLGHGQIFFGSEEADSALLGWSNASLSTKKPRAPANQNADELMDLSDDDDVYEDDLYSTSITADTRDHDQSLQNGNGTGDYNFRLHDRLWTLGPMRDITLGSPPTPQGEDQRSITAVSPDLELVVSHGSGKAGGLAVLQREINPLPIDVFRVEDAQGVWAVSVRATKTDAPQSSSSLDRYLIVSKYKAPDKEESVVYSAANSRLEEIKAPEFNPNDDCTIDVGTLADGSRMVQVLKSEVRSYESDLGLSQIYPVWDEDTSDEKTILSSSFADPYLLILRDDFTILTLQADESGDLDEISFEGESGTNKWLSGSFYEDKHGVFMSLKQRAEGTPHKNILLFLLNDEGKLFIFHLPDISNPIYVIEGADLLLPVLSSEAPPKRNTARETLVEITVANLGDSYHESPYLILRTGVDDIILYRPYHTSSEDEKSIANLRFSKIVNHHLAQTPSDGVPKSSTGGHNQRAKTLRALPNVGGFSTVFMSGESPSFIMKHASSRPHVQKLRGKDVHGLTSFNTKACEHGFVYVDIDGVIRTSRLPPETRFESSWASRKVCLRQQVDCVTYCPKSEVYALGTSHKSDFKLPEDDEIHAEWRNEVISFLPRLDRGSVEILNPKTWTIVDSYPLGPDERIMAIKNLSLEVSEITHEHKDMVVVGTSIVRGEDIATRGCIYVFEVINAVPDPGMPEKNRKLKLFAKEAVKGPVTAVSSIGGQGFLIAAQGQKCMVRGLKEDGSLLPVAFMDMQCYVTVVKELKGTGLCIMGDALKGLWFTGYSEEPYKMTLFGKDSAGLEVMAAEFLPDEKQLDILVADGDCNIHVLQYDPEDPKSSKGDRLLHRSTFHTGHFVSTMTLLPRTAVSSELAFSNSDEMETENSISLHQVLVTSQTGSAALVTTISEESYRRLSALQSQLINTLEHPCGLNPRAHRAVESDGIAGRGMIDGNLVRRWLDLGIQRKTEIAGRVGADTWQIRADLESISAAGLGYL